MLNVKSTKEFCGEIERYAKEYKLSYIEAILEYCEENDLEVETVSKLVSSNLKEKLQYEAENLNMIPKTSTPLPL
jgi:hypothetical protein